MKRTIFISFIALINVLVLHAQDININSSWSFITADSLADYHNGLPSSAKDRLSVMFM